MKIFLMVAAGVFVGLILFLYVGFWLIKRKLNSVFGDLGEAIKGLAAGIGSFPQFELELEPAGDTAWHHPVEIAAAIDLITGRGFEDAGRFLQNGMPDVIMGLFHHPTQHLNVVLYDTTQSDIPRLDVAADYGDDRLMFYSNVKHDGLDKPDGAVYSRHPDLDNAELLDRALENLPVEGRVAHGPADLPNQIKRFYDREQLWRAKRGGYTDEEIHRSIEASGNEATPESTDMSRRMLNSVLRDGLEEKLREAFLKTTTLSALEWEAVEDHLAIIQPMSDADSIADHFDTLYDWKDEDYDDGGAKDQLLEQIKSGLEHQSPNEVFQRLAADAPRAGELKHLDHIEDPARADFYALPPWPDDDEDDS